MTNGKRLAVIPSETIALYLETGYGAKWLEEYYNPGKYFDEVYLLSPLEKDNPHLLAMKVINTRPEQLKSRLKELKIDIIRAYGGYWACDMACNNKVSGVPVVVSVHDTNPELLHNSIKKADAVICMSSAVKQLVLSKFKQPDRIWILPNRVHFDVMRPYLPDEFAHLNNNYPYNYKILHVGRKAKQKNLDTLIKSLRILGDEYCLLAVGKGNADEYIKLAKEEGVFELCYFIEAIKSEELSRYFSWADCMCTPSRWEGFGMVFIEALACETVVVTSDIAPMNEYIQHMQNGLLVKDYEDPQPLAQMIRIACTDQTVRETLIRNARSSVEKFEKKRVDAMEVEYYKKILTMKDKGDFFMPLLEQVRQSFENKVKKVLPGQMQKKIRSLLMK